MILLNEIIAIERFIHKIDKPEDQILLKRKILTDPGLKIRYDAQKMVAYLVQLFFRKKIKNEVAIAGKLLLNDPEKSAYKQLINEIFNS